MVRESFITKLKKQYQDSMKNEVVGYLSIFTPPKSLFSNFSELKLRLKKTGNAESKSTKIAKKQTNFEKRYRKKIISTPKLLNNLKEIRRSSGEFVYFYWAKLLYSRFIPIDVIKKM